MSKRTGSYVTIDELIDEVGLDAARFFFLMSSPDTHMNFDLDLAKEQSLKIRFITPNTRLSEFKEFLLS